LSISSYFRTADEAEEYDFWDSNLGLKTAFELINKVAALSTPKKCFLSDDFLKLPCPMRLSVLNSREVDWLDMDILAENWLTGL
jgi:hypothetical protein